MPAGSGRELVRRAREYELYVMDSAGEIIGSPALRLTNDPTAEFGTGINDRQPTWSPDSTRIAFVTNRNPDDADVCDVWVMDAADTNADGFGDNLTQLTFDNDFECEVNGPAWSPTGNRIAFTSTRSGDYEIWVMNADGTGLVNVTNFPGQDFDAGWSPDGTQITFVSGRDGDYEIYSVPAPPPTGPALPSFATAPTQLTHNNTPDTAPDWGRRNDPTAVTVWGFVASRNQAGVALTWRTAVPAALGFWRSSEENARYRKLNRSVLPAALARKVGSYRFVDRAPTVSSRYYRLETVLLDGSSAWAGPVQAR